MLPLFFQHVIFLKASVPNLPSDLLKIFNVITEKGFKVKLCKIGIFILKKEGYLF